MKNARIRYMQTAQELDCILNEAMEAIEQLAYEVENLRMDTHFRKQMQVNVMHYNDALEELKEISSVVIDKFWDYYQDTPLW